MADASSHTTVPDTEDEQTNPKSLAVDDVSGYHWEETGPKLAAPIAALYEAANFRWSALISRGDLQEAQGVNGLCRRVSEWLEAQTDDANIASGQAYDSYMPRRNLTSLRSPG